MKSSLQLPLLDRFSEHPSRLFGSNVEDSVHGRCMHVHTLRIMPYPQERSRCDDQSYTRDLSRGFTLLHHVECTVSASEEGGNAEVMCARPDKKRCGESQGILKAGDRDLNRSVEDMEPVRRHFWNDVKQPPDNLR